MQTPFSVNLPTMFVDENDPEERLFNRFRRDVIKAGVIQECKRRRFFERKRKSRKAVKRIRRSFRLPQGKQSLPNKQEESPLKRDEDNWEIPDDNIPY